MPLHPRSHSPSSSSLYSILTASIGTILSILLSLSPLPAPLSPLPAATCFQTLQTDHSKIQLQLCHFPFSLGGTQLRIKSTLFNVIYKFYSCVIWCEDTECHPAPKYFSHWHCNHNRFHYPFLPVKASGDSVNCKWSLRVAVPINTISAINSFIGVNSSTYLCGYSVLWEWETG